MADNGTKFWVQRYLNEGWSPLPIPKGEKGPRIGGWESRDFTPAEFADDDNIGVHLGKHVNGVGLYDVDLDDKLAPIAADILMAPTARIHGRPGKPRSHRFYTCEVQVQHFVIHGLGGNNDTIIELRGVSPSTGSCTQTVLPPSIHPSGELLAWDVEQKPGHFKDPTPLIEQVKHVAIAVLLARAFPGPGHRHNPRMAMAGYLFRIGFDELIVKAIGRAVMRMIGGDEQDWLDTARTTIGKLKSDPEANVTGGTTLKEALTDGEQVIKKINVLVGRQDQAIRDEVLEEKDKKYFRVVLGNQPCVGDDTINPINFFSYHQFREMFIHETVPGVKDKKGKNRPGQKVADFWLEHTQRRFDQFVYAPPPMVAGPRDYNGWKGLTVAPVAGACPLIDHHLEWVICGGDAKLRDWVLNWCAALVQRPGQHATTALVLMGGQGTGKGFFAEDLLGSLFDARHFVKLSSGEQFYGRFAGETLSGRCLVFLDEATWGGDKRDAGILKDRVTGHTIFVDRKGIKAINEVSMMHLILASNEDWPIGLDRDDRRFVALKLENPRAQDPAYFEPLYEELNTGGRPAFLHKILTWPVDDVLLRQPPLTEAKTQLKVRSLPAVHAWWQDKLLDGCIFDGKGWPKTAVRTAIREDYVQEMQRQGVNRRLGPSAFIAEMEKMCPSLRRQKLHGKSREWQFPPLDQARKDFENFIGAPISWDGGLQPTLPVNTDSENEDDAPF